MELPKDWKPRIDYPSLKKVGDFVLDKEDEHFAFKKIIALLKTKNQKLEEENKELKSKISNIFPKIECLDNIHFLKYSHEDDMYYITIGYRWDFVREELKKICKLWMPESEVKWCDDGN